MLFQVVLVHVAHNKDQVRATLQRSPALHVRGRHIVAWARHLAALQRHMPSMHQAALSSSALYNSFIIEACHMPGIVVGCHLLCLGSCLARRVVLQLFVQTYHRLLSASGTSITNAYSMRTSSRIMHTFPFMQTHFKLLGTCTSLNSKSLFMQTLLPFHANA